MLVIRMRRMGAKKNPHFRLVVTEHRTARESDFLESLGVYDPQARPEKLTLDRERYAHWVKVGARPSDSVRTLVARHKHDVVATAAPAAVTAAPDAAPAVSEPAAS
jgi:small subunit ribosomal protein S16